MWAMSTRITKAIRLVLDNQVFTLRNRNLSYSFSGESCSTKVYPKPVVQVVEPDAIPVNIEASKILDGKALTLVCLLLN
jgi:hypothetical protein